mmetsp:Transcript_70972/g.183019  ORF Transcript_70972/g.183019 Transcript_70972/m.183019 type:complete len:126 (+) Transcript_70972:333-710(+)
MRVPGKAGTDGICRCVGAAPRTAIGDPWAWSVGDAWWAGSGAAVRQTTGLDASGEAEFFQMVLLVEDATEMDVGLAGGAFSRPPLALRSVSADERIEASMVRKVEAWIGAAVCMWEAGAVTAKGS